MGYTNRHAVFLRVEATEINPPPQPQDSDDQEQNVRTRVEELEKKRDSLSAHDLHELVWFPNTASRPPPVHRM